MRGVRPWRAVWFRQFCAAAEGMLYVLAGSFLTAVLVWKCGLPGAWVLRGAALLFWCIGAWFAGRRTGRHGRRHGAIEGMTCGLLLNLVWFCGAMVMGSIPAHWLRHVLLVCAAGAGGGIWGVNTKLHGAPD